MAGDIEGTILTEGFRTGRGTRFADVKSEQRVDKVRSGRDIRGGKGGVADRMEFETPQVKARMVDPLTTKPVISERGISSEAIQNVGQMLSKAAFDYSDRVDQVAADDVVLQYNEFARDTFYGNWDKGIKGLNELKGEAAVSARENYSKAIDGKLAELVGSMSPTVKQKALARMSSIRDTALNRGASHIAQAQNEAEVQLQARKAEDIGRELSVDFGNTPQLKDALMSLYGADSKGGQEAWDATVVQAAHNAYMGEYRRSGSGIGVLEAFRKATEDTVSMRARNVINEYSKAQEQHEEVAKRSAERDAKAQKKEALDEIMSQVMMDFDKNHGLIKSMSDVFAANPALAESPSHANAVWRYARSERKADEAEAKANIREAKAERAAENVERASDFYLDKLIPMKTAGEAFSDEGEFMQAAMDYGIKDHKKVKSMWLEMKANLTEDKASLNKQFTFLNKSLNNAFLGDDGDMPEPPGEGASKAEISKYNMALLANMAKPRGKKEEPQELQAIKGELFQIYQDKTKTPYERAVAMEEHIKKKMTDAGANSELVNVNNVHVLANQYRVKSYKDKLLAREEEKAKGLTTVAPAPPEGLSDIEAKAISSGYGLKPSTETKQRILDKAKKAGFSDVRFVEGEEIGGSPFTGYVGMIKQPDGTMKEQRIGVKRK